MDKIFRYQRWVLPGSVMKESKEILEFYYHFLQCRNTSLCTVLLLLKTQNV